MARGQGRLLQWRPKLVNHPASMRRILFLYSLSSETDQANGGKDYLWPLTYGAVSYIRDKQITQ